MRNFILFAIVFCFLSKAVSSKNIPSENSPPNNEKTLLPQDNDLERSLREDQNQAVKSWSLPSGFYISPGFGVSFAKNAESSSFRYVANKGSTMSSAKVEFENALVLSAEIGVRKVGASWSFGFEYDTERSSKEITFSGNLTCANGESSCSFPGNKIQIMNLYANFLYGFGPAYSNLGLIFLS